MLLELAAAASLTMDTLNQDMTSALFNRVTEPAWWREILCEMGYVEFCSPE